MLDEMMKKSPKRIRIEDYRDYMPYKVCTGGSFFSFVTLERLKDNTYKKIFGTSSPNRFNKATGKFRDNSVDDTLDENYSYLSSDEVIVYLKGFINLDSNDVKIFFDDKLINTKGWYHE